MPQAQLQNWKALKEQALANVEQGFLETALKQHGGDIKDIAADMGISTRAVYGKLKNMRSSSIASAPSYRQSTCAPEGMPE